MRECKERGKWGFPYVAGGKASQIAAGKVQKQIVISIAQLYITAKVFNSAADLIYYLECL